MRRKNLDDVQIPKSYKKVIDEFTKEALKRYRNKIRRIIMYGSVTRGEVNEDSDIDVLVIWKGKRLDAMHSLGDIAFKLLLTYGEDISIHPITPEHYNYLRKINTQFIQSIKKDGVILA